MSLDIYHLTYDGNSTFSYYWVTAAFPLLFIGLIFQFFFSRDWGICLWTTVLFQLVTLPVEYNASRQAIEGLAAGGYIQNGEISPAAKF